MKKGVVAVDLFCGAGGLTRGLLDSGIKVLKGYDFDGAAKKTYEQNNHGSKFFHMDVLELKKDEVVNDIDTKKNRLLLAGCAPCQPFSAINQKDISKDERKNLVLKFGELIETILPDYVFMENVPGLLKGRGKDIFMKFLAVLKNNSYKYDFKILNAMDYGVPQKRKRLVLIASKHSEVQIPPHTHDSKNGREPQVILRDILPKFPRISAGKKNTSVPNHEARGLGELNLQRLRSIRKNGGSRKDLPKELILKCHKKHEGHSDVYGRMSLNEVSPTLTCKCTSISNGRFGHPTQNRAISIREAAAIQTFSDRYIFYGNMTENTRFVGNAVPVKFAKVFGEYFVKLAQN